MERNVRLTTGWLCLAISLTVVNGRPLAAATGYQITITVQPDPGNPESYAPARIDFSARVKDAAGNIVDPKTLDMHWTFGDFFPNTQRSKGHDYDTLKPIYLYVDPGAVAAKLFVRKKDDHARTGEATLKLVIRKPQTELRKLYVAPDGSDANPGTRDKPWKNLHKSIANLKPGDTLFLRGGTYDISKTVPTKGTRALGFGTDGTPARPITVRGLPGEEAIITSNYTSGGFFIRRNFVRVRDLVIEKCRGGILMRGRGLVFDGLTIRHILGHGNANTSAFYPHRMTESVIRNCLSYDIWMSNKGPTNSTGVMLYSCAYNVIENNEVHTTGDGVYDKRGGINTIIRYNYFHDVRRGFARSSYGEDTRDNRIYGNIVSRSRNGVAMLLLGDMVFNNTFVSGDWAFRGRALEKNPKCPSGSEHVKAWNNICLTTKKVYIWDRKDAYLDYNVVGSGMWFNHGRTTYETLEAWRAATGLDAHTVQLKSARFRVPAPKRPEDFRLPPDSPLRKGPMLGRFGKEMRGAYPFDDIVIGRPARMQRP